MEDKCKEEMIKQVMIKLQELGLKSSEDKTKSKKDKLTEADVLLDTMHFLKDYDENVKVLDKYWRAKRYKHKYELDIDDK